MDSSGTRELDEPFSFEPVNCIGAIVDLFGLVDRLLALIALRWQV